MSNFWFIGPLAARLFYVAYTAKKIVEIIFRYLHNFLGDKPDYFQVLCNSLTYASIGYGKLFRLQYTLGPYIRGTGHRTHTERHKHCRSCRLQTVGNAHQGKD